MVNLSGESLGTKRALAATVAVATSTAMFESGELSPAQYIDGMMLGNSIFGGSVPVMDGLKAMMRLWMVDPLGADGY